jgi:uncharacterized protein (DUF2252 family)
MSTQSTEKQSAARVRTARDRVQHLSRAERVAIGKAARSAVPRSRHAEFDPPSDRPDPITLLEEQAGSRVPDLVPIRYGRMLVSPFAFYRGAARIMASDLAQTPTSGIRVQLCGDAHLSNFGVFASPERRLMFDLNDFDETLPGPWEWDVKRLAASMVVAGRDNGYSRKQRDVIVRDTAGQYRKAMREFAAEPNMAVWYARFDIEAELNRLRSTVQAKQIRRTEHNLAKARTRDSMREFAKLTTEVDGERRIISDPPLIVPVEELFPEVSAKQLTDTVAEFVRGYRRSLQTDRRALLEQYRFVHLARKVVGVGSVGTRAWILLMLGRDANDPLFLQLKEAQASVLEPFLGKSAFAKHGQRVVEGQRLMQAASDIMLGWIRIQTLDGVMRDFYVRQLWDGKGSALVEMMDPPAMTAYAGFCGQALAKAHARSGDAIAIASYLGAGESSDRALASFAESYADQNERDYDALQDAVATGRVAAETGL